jgi:hypothetical protein
VLVTLLAGTANAQPRWIRVDSNQAEALVFADSTWLGTASDGLLALPPETRLVHVVPPTPDAWSIPAVTHPVDTAGDDTLVVSARFPFYYRFESVPSGASVYLESDGARRLLGQTPLDHVSDEPLAGTVSFDRTGHLIRTVEPGDELWNRHLVLLETVDRLTANESDLSISGHSGSAWIDYAATGVAVAGAVLAIHFKTKADNRYEIYNETRDPALKSEIKELDLYSGVALGAMQVGIGVIAFRLVF